MTHFDALALIAAEVMASCRDVTGKLSEKCVSLTQEAEQLAADPMNNAIAGMAKMQSSGAVEVERAATFSNVQTQTVSSSSIGYARDGLSKVVLSEDQPRGVQRK